MIKHPFRTSLAVQWIDSHSPSQLRSSILHDRAEGKTDLAEVARVSEEVLLLAGGREGEEEEDRGISPLTLTASQGAP